MHQDDGWFQVRRLGHVNLYISEYEKSLTFYRNVVGLWDGWTRPKIGGGFLNNGASHHDVGFLPWHSKERRVAASGPGLNHLAFDAGTEADLARGYRAALADNYKFLASADHVVAKSLYCFDPNGVQLEIYADTSITFRDDDFLEMRRATVKWDPPEANSADPTPYFVSDHKPQKSLDSVFHATQIGGATMVTDRFEETKAFFSENLGMKVTVDAVDGGFAVLSGSIGGRDVVIYEKAGGLKDGLHHVSFPVFDEQDLDESLEIARLKGIVIDNVIDHDLQKAVVLRDPDNIPIKLFVDRDKSNSEQLSKLSSEDALWLP